MAVKKIFIGKSKNSKIQESKIHQEIEILSKLNHKNIIKYYGSETQNENIKIYLEFIDMGSLTSLTKTYGNLKPQTVSNFTKQILKGLEYLHYHNIIHRDIKGDNIFLSNEGIIKLGDFGSAKKIGQQSYLKSIIGTVCWMAPEIFQKKKYGRSADIWSLGCTVYEMLLGKPPFLSKSQYLTSKLIIEYQNGNLNWYNIGLLEKDFICSCLKKRPEERYNVKKLLDHPFIVEAEDIGDGVMKRLERYELDRKNSDEVNKIMERLRKKKIEIKNKRLFKKNSANEDIKQVFDTPNFAD